MTDAEINLTIATPRQRAEALVRVIEEKRGQP